MQYKEIDILTQALETLFRIEKEQGYEATEDVCESLHGLATLVGIHKCKSAEEVIAELEEKRKEEKRIAAEEMAKWQETEDYKLFIDKIREKFNRKR